jgi:molybdenum cofactor cytidylyltransferase
MRSKNSTGSKGSTGSCAAIVPAAGKGERFGGGKLLTPVDGVPMIERTIRSLLDGGVETVIVVLAPESDVSPSSVAALGDPRVRTVVNRDPSRGMFSSIQAGLRLAPSGANPVLVLPGDMPFVRTQTVTAVVRAALDGAEPLSPTHDGRRGHPLALPGCTPAALLAADPRESLNDVLRMLLLPRRELPVDDPGILRDVDTRADL